MEYKKFSDLITNNALAYADKVCIYFKEKTYTYAQAEEMVTKTAHVLQANGIKKGDRVTLLLNNCPEFIFSYFAVSKIGAIIVPLNVFLKEREISINMNDCGSEYLITSSAFAKVVEPLLPLVSRLKKIFAFEDTPFESINIYTSDKASKELINTDISPDDITAIIYTSGTTGKPKGVMLSHYNLVENSRSYITGVEGRQDDITLLILPMFHSFTFVACVSGPFFLSSSIAILESVMDMAKEGYAEFLARVRPTLLLGVPQVYSTMARVKLTPEQRAKFPFRAVFSGGAPLPVETINLFKENYGIPLVEGYGLSEASPGVAVNPSSGIQKPGTVGFPLVNIQLKIVDENSNEVPVNTPGELCVKGPNVMKGYWNQPEETARVIKDGWLYTGDIATKDEDGYYAIVDRLKDLIITKGMNVYPREIEELLHHYKGVAAAAVIGVPDKDGSEIVVAYIKPMPDAIIKEHDLKEYLKDLIATFKVPKKFIFTDDIPVTPSGKVMKKELKEKFKRDYSH